VSQKQVDGKVKKPKSRIVLSNATPSGFKWRHFWPEIILLNVHWYCCYGLSYRDLEEMMAERGIEVDHSTINRWVLKYAPELGRVCELTTKDE
jgi:transposase-like protein